MLYAIQASNCTNLQLPDIKLLNLLADASGVKSDSKPGHGNTVVSGLLYQYFCFLMHACFLEFDFLSVIKTFIIEFHCLKSNPFLKTLMHQRRRLMLVHQDSSPGTTSSVAMERLQVCDILYHQVVSSLLSDKNCMFKIYGGKKKPLLI